MISIQTTGSYYYNGQWLEEEEGAAAGLPAKPTAREGSMAVRIMDAHSDQSDSKSLRITFDALASHDITYVGIVQTARAGGMIQFPLPYVLTNCHNSLCAVGGTINEDDHRFGLSAAKRYGGAYVPAHVAVIHQYVREMMAGCGKMILGSDSHTRYGALGCMGFGEGGPELVKQLLGRTYDLAHPEVVAVYVEGAPRPGVGPQDVALALIKAVFEAGTVKNKVMEFFGPGLANLSVDYRLGIDVMTTETTCLSSIWQTDELVQNWLAAHGRMHDFRELEPLNGTWYDSVIRVQLDAIEPMIALPFHPSNAYTIREFIANADELLAKVEEDAAGMLGKDAQRPNLREKIVDGAVYADQGIIAGCAGSTYENMARATAILKGSSVGNGMFGLSMYPASQPQFMELLQTGLAAELVEAGVVIKTAFCGPCFGAGDVPSNGSLSIRHSTRNFPNREGSRPVDGQMAYVALMDARSIAATAVNQGRITPATDLPELPKEGPIHYRFDSAVYAKRVYQGFGSPRPEQELEFGPNITDWPTMLPLPENLVLTVCAAIHDPVTTTDELIPSGETSSYRSNPLKLSEFTLSRKEPEYVGRAKKVFALEECRRKITDQSVPSRLSAAAPCTATPEEVYAFLAQAGFKGREAKTGIGSVVFARKPGDGSAREQAASCQKVLGGWANIAEEYATKRYRANLVNWGMLPFILDDSAQADFAPGDNIVISGIRSALEAGKTEVEAAVQRGDTQRPIRLLLPGLTDNERAIILSGCLINNYAGK